MLYRLACCPYHAIPYIHKWHLKRLLFRFSQALFLYTRNMYTQTHTITLSLIFAFWPRMLNKIKFYGIFEMWCVYFIYSPSTIIHTGTHTHAHIIYKPDTVIHSFIQAYIQLSHSFSFALIYILIFITQPAFGRLL